MRISLRIDPPVLDQTRYQAKGQLCVNNESREIELDVEVIVTPENRLLGVSYRGVEIARRVNCVDQDLGRPVLLSIAAILAGKLLTALMENRICPCCKEPYSLTNPIQDTPDDPMLKYILLAFMDEVSQFMRAIDSPARLAPAKGDAFRAKVN